MGLGGSSGAEAVDIAEGLAADVEAEMEPARSFAGVLMAEIGGVVDSVASMADEESRLDRSSLCEISCRYSSSSCRFRSSYSPSS